MSVNHNFSVLDFTTALCSLTMTDIQQAVLWCTFHTVEKHSQSKLEEVSHCLSLHDYTSLMKVAMSKQRLDEHETDCIIDPDSAAPQTGFHDGFFETVTEECWQECIANFINAMGSKALSHALCAVCAGTFFACKVE